MSDSNPTIRQADRAAQQAAGDLLRRYFAEEGFAVDETTARDGLAALLDDPRGAVFLATLPGAPGETAAAGEAAGTTDEAAAAPGGAAGATEAAGVVTVTWTTSAAHGRLAEIAELYVRPASRGRGVATALLEAALAWARRQGCTVCRLAAGPDGELRHGVAGFFTARGFDDDYRSVLVRDLGGVERRDASRAAGPSAGPGAGDGGS